MMHTRLYQLIVKMEDAYLLVVYQRIEKEQQKQKQVYDQQEISAKLKIGDQVLVEQYGLKIIS